MESLILDLVDNGLVVLDPSQRIIHWNQWIADASHISSSEAKGRLFSEIFSKTEDDRLAKSIESAFKAHQASVVSHRIDTPPPLPLFDHYNRRLSQYIIVKPFIHPDRGECCLLQIKDFTGIIKREQQLIEQSQALRSLAVKHRAIVDNASEGFIQLNSQGIVISCNSAAENIFEYSEEQILNRPLRHFIDGADFDSPKSLDHICLNAVPLELTGILKSGFTAPIELTLSKVEYNRERLYVAIIRDISARKKIEQRLYQERERAQVTLQSIADAVITTTAEGLIYSMNSLAEQLTGWAFSQAKNRPVSQVFSVINETTRSRTRNPVTECLELCEVVINDQDLILVDYFGNEYPVTESAAPILDNNNELIGAVLVFRDMTDARQLAAQLHWQALHDPLTGLLNRREFEQQLKRLLDSARQTNTKHCLLYMDLDQFKVVNDTCGHAAGDELLRQITALLHKHIRSSDVLARLGGDEFGVLIENCGENDALRVANLLRQEIQEFRFAWQNKTFILGISIGLVSIVAEYQNTNDLLSAADSACYVAKDTGRNRVHVHQVDHSNVSEHQREMQWISKIQWALDENRFRLYAQKIRPTSNQHSQHDIHYEILLRMEGEDGRLIPPGAFIPAAERYNLMQNVDQWVINNLLAKLDAASHLISELPMLSINLSGVSLSDEHFLGMLQSKLAENRIPANHFCFEITETSAISNLVKVNHFIQALSEKGCQFSLDDFGSGLSSFVYLKNLPVNFLKIDGHFIKDINHDPIDRAFVESINQIGHVLGLTTIAEFVEDDKILETLEIIGVDFVQGYGIEKPIPFEELLQRLKAAGTARPENPPGDPI